MNERKKYVLVTGSEGSLGQAIIPELVSRGFVVTGVDNLSRYGKRPGHAKCNYEFIQSDVTDYNTCKTLTYAMDYVIHAAGSIFGIGGFNKYCADVLSKDIMMTSNMLRASIDHDVKRFIYMSSSMVYERCSISTEDILTSENFLVPFTDYGLSKYTGERLVRSFQKQYGLDFTIWRPFNIITPYEIAGDEIGTNHVFADFIRNIVVKKKNPLPIIGNGKQVRCFTNIHDISQAIADFSFVSESLNEDFNLGRNEPVTMIKLAKDIHEIAIEKNLIANYPLEFETVKNYPNDVLIRVPGTEKAKKILSWEATTSLKDSLNECLEFLKK